MALKCRLSFLLLVLCLFITLAQARHPIAHRRSRAWAFIDSQCKKTLYATLCSRYLLYYVNNFTDTLSHQRLAQIALKVSLVKAESTQAYVTGVAKELERTRARDYLRVMECLDQINDGVAQLKNCIAETQKIKENGESSDFPWHASNVMTWMSTAVTDASTCVNGFPSRAIRGKTKALIKAKVLNLEQTTSIALALFNRFAARYRSSHVKRPRA